MYRRESGMIVKDFAALQQDTFPTFDRPGALLGPGLEGVPPTFRQA